MKNTSTEQSWDNDTVKAVSKTIPAQLNKIHDGFKDAGDVDEAQDMSRELSEYEENVMEHIKKVQENIQAFNHNMTIRSVNHDLSKFSPEEKEIMESNFDKLRITTYGSDAYKALLNENRPALNFHYARNDHHPEHFPRGVNDMDLFQIVEMFCDWKAAVEKHDDGDIMKSLDINRDRFGLSDQLHGIFVNTVKRWETK